MGTTYAQFLELLKDLERLRKEIRRKDIMVGELDKLKREKHDVEVAMRNYIWRWAGNMRRFICDNPELFTLETYRIMTNHFNVNKEPMLRVRKDGALTLRMERDCGEYREMGNVIVVPKDYITDRPAYIERRKLEMAEKRVDAAVARAKYCQDMIRHWEAELTQNDKDLVKARADVSKLKK